MYVFDHLSRKRHIVAHAERLRGVLKPHQVVRHTLHLVRAVPISMPL